MPPQKKWKIKALIVRSSWIMHTLNDMYNVTPPQSKWKITDLIINIKVIKSESHIFSSPHTSRPNEKFSPFHGRNRYRTSFYCVDKMQAFKLAGPAFLAIHSVVKVTMEKLTVCRNQNLVILAKSEMLQRTAITETYVYAFSSHFLEHWNETYRSGIECYSVGKGAERGDDIFFCLCFQRANIAVSLCENIVE